MRVSLFRRSLRNINARSFFSQHSRKKDNKLYEVLGVNSNSSDDEIKQAFRKAAMANHPDRGGDEEKFKSVNKAYEILKDPEKRKMYDQFGEEGVEMAEQGGGMNPDVDLSDLFGNIFNGGGGQSRKKKGYTKREQIVEKIQLSLEELYIGAVKSIKINKQKVCKTCDGLGAASKKSINKCTSCKGKGYRVHMRPVGPGMVQQIESECEACGATGETIAAKDKCGGCKGKKVYKEDSVFNVTIPAGSAQGEQLLMRGAADEAPNEEAGDVIVLIEEKKHDVFERNGSDLVMEKVISLQEALLGFSFRVKHLDEKNLRIKSPTNHIVSHGEALTLEGKGMPIRNSTNKGGLFVKINVEMPKTLTEAQKEALSKVFKIPKEKNNEDDEEVELAIIDPREEEAKRRANERREERQRQRESSRGGKRGRSQGQGQECQVQ